MQGYEAVFILHPELSEEAQSSLLDKFKSLIQTQGGEVVRHTPWGRRKLAYEVKKNQYGIYHLFHLSHHPEALKALETQFRYEEDVLKWLSVKVEDLEEEGAKFDKLLTEGTIAQTLTDR